MPAAGKTMFITTPIDVEAWNDAKWSGVAYLHDPNGQSPPALGLVFRNRQAGERIFSGWIDRFGRKDVREELRISIVEGDMPGEEFGYSVQIGPEPDVVIERARAAGITNPDELLLTMISRIHRMNPPLDSTNLLLFKQDFATNGRFLLIPVFAEKQQMTPDEGFAIEKTRIYFRRVDEIGPNDLDAAVLRKPR